jgi:hypothetical protein
MFILIQDYCAEDDTGIRLEDEHLVAYISFIDGLAFILGTDVYQC